MGFFTTSGGEEPDALTLLRESLAWPHLKQRLFVGQHPEALQTLHTQAPGIVDSPHNRPCMTTGIGPLKSMLLTLSAEIIFPSNVKKKAERGTAVYSEMQRTKSSTVN